jgi:hypothetical protein
MNTQTELQVTDIVKNLGKKGYDVQQIAATLLKIGPEVVPVLISLFNSGDANHKVISQDAITRCLIVFAKNGSGEAEQFLEALYGGKVRTDFSRSGHQARVTATDYISDKSPIIITLKGLFWFVFQLVGVVLLMAATKASYAPIGQQWRKVADSTALVDTMIHGVGLLAWVLLTILCALGSIGLLGYTISYPFRVVLPRVFTQMRYGFSRTQKLLFPVLCAVLCAIGLAVADAANKGAEKQIPNDIGSAEKFGRIVSVVVFGSFPQFAIGLLIGGVAGWFASSRLRGRVLCPKCHSWKTVLSAPKDKAQNKEISCEQCGHVWHIVAHQVSPSH